MTLPDTLVNLGGTAFRAPAAGPTWFASPQRIGPVGMSRLSTSLQKLGGVRTLLNAMPDMVMILNAHRQIAFGNVAFSEFCRTRGLALTLGDRPGEVLRCRNVPGAPGGCGTSAACRTCGAMQAVLEGLAGKTVANECRISRENGEALDLRVWASPLDWEGEACVVVVAADISDVKRRQMLERIFFHDVLNTAGGIWSMAELIRTDPSMVDEFKDSLHLSADSLVSEIRSQSMLVAAENNELQVDLVPLRAIEVVDSAMRLMRFHEAAEGRLICRARDAIDFEFYSDPVLVKRVLCNLIKNALEASQPGETISLGAHATPGGGVLWCHNAAVMPEAVQLQLFQRNFSTKGRGRGLGTYSVRLLTERYLRGTVGFESREGSGTTFLVTLPRTPSRAGQPPDTPHKG